MSALDIRSLFLHVPLPTRGFSAGYTALVIIKHLESGSAFLFMLDRPLPIGPLPSLWLSGLMVSTACGFAGVV